MELILSFNLYMSFRDQTQVVRFVWEAPVPADHLASLLSLSFSLPGSHYVDRAGIDSL